MTRPTVIPCSAFGGRSPKTGRRVWSRHRWDGGAWGKGRCEFCGRCLLEVLARGEAPDAAGASHSRSAVPATEAT